MRNSDNYNFDIFKDYKCKGQYKMKFNNTNIEIVEEKVDKQVKNKEKTVQIHKLSI